MSKRTPASILACFLWLSSFFFVVTPTNVHAAQFEGVSAEVDDGRDDFSVPAPTSASSHPIGSATDLSTPPVTNIEPWEAPAPELHNEADSALGGWIDIPVVPVDSLEPWEAPAPE